MGRSIEVGSFIGSARQYFYSTNETTYYLNEGYFYLCKLGEKINNPVEIDHILKWVEPFVAIENLVHAHQAWAIKEVVKPQNC